MKRRVIAALVVTAALVALEWVLGVHSHVPVGAWAVFATAGSLALVLFAKALALGLRRPESLESGDD
jgi:hypothetical protein